MYLKKVEIVGFKSFATKTTLHFLPDGTPAGQLAGITAIVGPNGSGKSNVADAIRWAIGEQSSKNLRGKKSEDVIFAGTDKKAKLGAASVTLFFDNADKRLDLEFTEVSITRRVYRSGEGEYLINNARVRLMDVVDLLAKAGIGKDSYSVITQGMSDALLRASALERRSMLEDAAGVKQYQIEKERARRRLDATEENLAQVDALLIELEPHLKNLRRQAEKAATGKELAAELKTKQEILYGYLWHTFQAERGLVGTEKDTEERAVFDLERFTQKQEEEVTALSAKMQMVSGEEELEKEVARLRDEINEHAKNIAVNEGKIYLEKERQKTEEVIRTIPVDLAYVEGALDEITEEQKILLQELQKENLSLQDVVALRLRAESIQEKLTVLKAKAGKGTVEEKTIITLPPAEQAESEQRIVAIEQALVMLREVSLQQSTLLEEALAQQVALREESRVSRETFFRVEKEWREKEYLLSRKKDALNELKIRLARVEVREEDLVALVHEELHCAPSVLAKVEGEIEKEKLERTIARLKVEAEHVGSIDPLVVEEFTETEERFLFLQKESGDLREALVSLESVITEMDQKIEVAFKQAYAEIRKKFSEYFMLIFGGGKADMILEKQVKRRLVLEEDFDEINENEAEALYGVEVTACPPGKKITSLSMLSGGERSLASLALLFAIIAYNPPPFAVLDEVEAALDEANSRRFGKMLKELSKHTQFIAITHNRETMRQASLIYGVTMGGDGISQLLSVKLDEALEKEG